jgi:hypothetical protein
VKPVLCFRDVSESIWRPQPPASEAALAALRNQAPPRLPEGYLQQLANSNGGEGDLGVNPGWIQFWPAENVISFNAGYEIGKWLPGFFGFGSNGGGELLAFDLREGEPYPIVMVPFIGMDHTEAIRISTSFDELRELIGKPYAET